MRLFETAQFRLLRLAARFKIEPKFARLWISNQEVEVLVQQMMREGYFAEQFVALEDPSISPFEMRDALSGWLETLGWTALSDESRFRFLTALYAKEGRESDVASYYAMLRWMADVGHELPADSATNFVADWIGAELIYSSYYAYSYETDGDLIPSIEDPLTHNWKAEREARPKLVFADWLNRHPHDYDKHMPIVLEHFHALKV